MILGVKKMASFIKKLRTFKVLFDAVSNDDPDHISTSNIALLKLRLKKSFDSAVRYPEELNRAQFLFYGDTNHTDNRLQEFFYSEENMDRMAQAGVKHIFPEIEPKLQESVTAMAEGRMDAKDLLTKTLEAERTKAIQKGDRETLSLLKNKTFINARLRRFETLCTGFRRAHDRGMAIHCLDERENLDAADVEAHFRYTNKIRLWVEKKYKAPKPIHGKLLLKFALDHKEMSEQMIALKTESLIKTREDDDKQLARRMMKAAGHEKGATLFGAGHARSLGGLFDTLGQDRTLRVDLYSSRDMSADRLMGLPEDQGVAPHYIHLLDEGKLLKIRNFPGVKPR